MTVGPMRIDGMVYPEIKITNSLTLAYYNDQWPSDLVRLSCLRPQDSILGLSWLMSTGTSF